MSFFRVVDHYRMDSYKRPSQSTESMPEVVEPGEFMPVAGEF